MRITLKQTTDYQSIAQMDSILFSECYPIDDWSECIWWIGFHKGTPVAYCGMKVFEGTVYMCRAGVIESAQGNGIQKKLINKRLEYAKSLGIDLAITYTSHDNAASMNSLIKCGFRPYTPQWAWDGDEFVYWRKT